MNPGYLSYILLTLSLILVCFGWRTHAIGSASARSAALFCMVWVVCAAAQWRAFGVSGTGALLPAAILAATALRSAPRKEAATALTYGFLTGAVYSLIELLQRMDPLMVVLGTGIDPAAAACVMAAACARKPMLQLAVLSIALIVNDVYAECLYAGRSPASFGDREFQDVWWGAAFGVRFVSAAGAATLRLGLREGVRIRGWLRVRR